MPAIGTRFWCPLMYRAIATNKVANPTAGVEDNMLDYNPDTIFMGSSPENLSVTVNLDPTYNFGCSVNAICIFVRNESAIDTQLRLTVYGKANPGDSWAVKANTNNVIDCSKFFPLVLYECTPSIMRYWYFVLFRFGIPDLTVEGGMFFLGRYHDLTSRWNWQSPEGDAFMNHVVVARDGRKLIEGGNNEPIRKFERHYEYLSAAEIAVIRAAWEDTKGGRYPMAITDDIPSTGWNPLSSTCNSKTSRLVRFNHPQDQDGKAWLGEYETQSGLWNVTLYLEEIPWTGEGILT